MKGKKEKNQVLTWRSLAELFGKKEKEGWVCVRIEFSKTRHVKWKDIKMVLEYAVGIDYDGEAIVRLMITEKDSRKKKTTRSLLDLSIDEIKTLKKFTTRLHRMGYRGSFNISPFTPTLTGHFYKSVRSEKEMSENIKVLMKQKSPINPLTAKSI